MDAQALQELTSRLLAQNPGFVLQALQSMPTSLENGEAPGPVEGYVMYDPAKTAYGQSFLRYDPQGAFVGEGQFKKPGNALKLTREFVKDMAPLALAALGANGLGAALGQPSIFGAGGLLGGAEAAAAGEAGGAGFGIGGGSSTLTPAAIEAGLGTPGYGFNAAAAGSGLFNPATIGAGAGLTFGPAAAGTLAGAAGSGAATTAAGAGAAGGLLKAALPIAGAVLGGTSGGKDTTATTTKDMDPRLANYVYGPDGTGGLLGSATKLFNDQMATGGLNELQRQGIDMQKNYLMNPAYAQGYTNMMNVGQGLLGGGVAGNPFRR